MSERGGKKERGGERRLRVMEKDGEEVEIGARKGGRTSARGGVYVEGRVQYKEVTNQGDS